MKELFKNIWKGVKFAFSATIGLPCACAATALLGAAYLLAEATNIVEAKVKKNLFGKKEVLKSPFFESVAKGLKKTLEEVWKDYGVYAHLTLAELALDKTTRQKLFSPTEVEEISSTKNPVMEIAPVPTSATIVPTLQKAVPIPPSLEENKALTVANLVEQEKPKPSAPPLPKNLDIEQEKPKPSNDKVSTSPKPISVTLPFENQNINVTAPSA